MSNDGQKVTDLIITKAKTIAKGAELLAERTNDWMVIKSFLKNRLGEIKLTPNQEEKLKRYQFVFNLLSDFRDNSESEVVNQLMHHFGLKIAQAYEDLSCAKELYSFVFDLNKQFELKIMMEANKMMLQKAFDSNDLKAYAVLEKNRVKMLELIVEPEETSDDFEPHTLVFQFNPELIGANKDVDMKSILEFINNKRNAKVNLSMLEEAEVVKP